MNRKDKFIVSLMIASFVTIIHIGWRKFGGLLSGGRYSDSHTWTELYGYIPEFAFLFVVFFAGVYVWEGMKKKEILFKCPKCGNVIESSENIKSICQSCGSNMERLDGFFNRHPEKK